MYINDVCIYLGPVREELTHFEIINRKKMRERRIWSEGTTCVNSVWKPEWICKTDESKRWNMV